MTTAASGEIVGRDGAHRERVGERLTRRRRRDLGALALAFLVTAFWFHDLIRHLATAVLYQPNDESYSIRLYWAAAHFGTNPFFLHRDILNGYPEGLPIPTAINWANLMIPGTIWAWHYLVGLTAAENIFLLGGFVLSTFSIYLLLDRFGFHPIASAYAAYGATFTPWMFERAGAGHHGFMQIWVFVVEIVALLNLHHRRTWSSAAIAGLSVALVFYANSYYGLLGCVLFAVFIVVDFVRLSSWRDRLWAITLLDISIVAGLIGFSAALIAWIGDRQAVSAGVSNPYQEVQNGGATIASYLMPGTRNPFLGDITMHFYPRANYDWSENTLFLGWTLIALSLAGIALIVRRHPSTLRTSLLRYFLVCMAIVAPVAFLFSLKAKTYVFGVDLPMPSYVIGHITTFWRIFARFGVLVTIALAILAAVALNAAIGRWKQWGKVIALVALGALIFEHAISFPPAFVLNPPSWSVWLKEQPFGSVANYPLPSDKGIPELILLADSYYNQTYNKQPQFMLFGSGYGETREDAIRILARYVDDPLTPGILKAEQVKYVLLHDDVYRAEGLEPPAIPAGMHLVKKLTGNVRALELDRSVEAADLNGVLRANAASIALVQNLPVPSLQTHDMPMGVDGTRKLVSRGTLDLSWKDPRLAMVQFLIHASSPSGPRTLQLLDDNENVLAQSVVGTSDTQVVLGPVPVTGLSSTFRLGVDGAAPVTLRSIQVQPVANVTKSLRDVH